MTTKELLTSALLLILLCNSPVLSQTAIDNSHNDYIYDNASRLVSSSYTSGSNSNRYNTQYSYDCMGNITSLSRNGLLDDGSYGLILPSAIEFAGGKTIKYTYSADGHKLRDLTKRKNI